MKYFDLTLLPSEEKNPKIHKVTNELFRQGLKDIPRDLAEKMVELGFGRWVPFSANSEVNVPQAFNYPEQLFFVNTQTHSVKGVHVTSLVEGTGTVPADLPEFCLNLVENARFAHDPADCVEPDDLEEDELLDILDAQDLLVPEEVVEPEPKPEPTIVPPPVNKVKAEQESRAKLEEKTTEAKEAALRNQEGKEISGDEEVPAAKPKGKKK